ncbi:MAG: 4a-hydroxytetrahydrobiopterin dehydratase [Anaerolineae bacterium]|nr:4a-hydroxytetrahydrobiopterin dehydratase [Anaerolineae bacterium]
MKKLDNMQCAPIDSKSIRLSDIEITQFLKDYPDWMISQKEGEQRIEKVFTFKDFNQAMEFTNKVAQEAEKENHHPAILTEWAKVTITWWTHKVKGLHQNDFIMAAKTDRLFRD